MAGVEKQAGESIGLGDPRLERDHNNMKIRDGLLALNRVAWSVVSLAKQAWLFPRSIPAVIRQRRQQTVLDALEAERLDRIRNPADYRGK